MRVVFAGTPDVALPALDAVEASPHELVAVLTRPDAPAGRGRRRNRSPVALRADALGVDVLQPRRPAEPEFLDRLREIAPDVVAIVAYGALVPASALAVPRLGWVNVHFSLLPAWRGAAPVQHALLHGDEMTGATTFVLEPDLDTGPVLGVVTEPIRPDDTAGALLDRLAHAGAGLLVHTLDGLDAGALRAVPQPLDGVSLAPKITPDDARVDWATPAVHVDRLVRACTLVPGAWTTFRGRRIKLGPVGVLTAGHDGTPPLEPGQLLGSRDQVVVGTATAALRLGSVQPEGKAAMPALEWARGARVSPGERFA